MPTVHLSDGEADLVHIVLDDAARRWASHRDRHAARDAAAVRGLAARFKPRRERVVVIKAGPNVIAWPGAARR